MSITVATARKKLETAEAWRADVEKRRHRLAARLEQIEADRKKLAAMLGDPVTQASAAQKLLALKAEERAIKLDDPILDETDAAAEAVAKAERAMRAATIRETNARIKRLVAERREAIEAVVTAVAQIRQAVLGCRAATTEIMAKRRELGVSPWPGVDGEGFATHVRELFGLQLGDIPGLGLGGAGGVGGGERGVEGFRAAAMRRWDELEIPADAVAEGPEAA
jgi:hypothetical protein